jgi:peptidoglycan/LPS O-acetylase OafA/YrhL
MPTPKQSQESDTPASTPETAGTPRRVDQLPALDGVRGAAALLVVFFHYFKDHPLSGGIIENSIQRLSAAGQTGVDLFFVLSGFLITRILLSTRGSTSYFSHFYIRRSLRIWPLYYAYLCVALLLLPWLQGASPPPFSTHWWWWAFLQNIPPMFHVPDAGPSHYWSLAVEEHFYLFWPLLVSLLPKRRLVWVSWGLILLSLLARPPMMALGLSTFECTLTRLDALSMGTLLALWEPAFRQTPERWRRRFVMGFWTLLGLLIPVFAFAGGTSSYWVQLFKYPLIGGFYMCALGTLLCLPTKHALAGLLASPVPCLVGTLSFGLYVYHPLCLWLAGSWLPAAHQAWGLPLGLALSLAIAALSFLCLERPFLRLKRHFPSS